MSHHHDHAGHHADHRPANRGLHKDWRTWTVVGLMLLGMAAYVLSMDEEDQPGGVTDPAMPAAAE